MKKKKEEPKEVAVFVTDIDTGDHLVVVDAIGRRFLLEHDERVPKVSTVVILECTFERPLWYGWYKPKEGLKAAGGQFSLDGTWKRIYTWRVKRK